LHTVLSFQGNKPAVANKLLPDFWFSWQQVLRWLSPRMLKSEVHPHVRGAYCHQYQVINHSNDGSSKHLTHW
jgi:hypothetical protein